MRGAHPSRAAHRPSCPEYFSLVHHTLKLYRSRSGARTPSRLVRHIMARPACWLTIPDQQTGFIHDLRSIRHLDDVADRCRDHGCHGMLQRQRPPAPLIAILHDYSFPSGHTFSSVVFFGMLMHIVYQNCMINSVKWWLIILFSLLVLAIGFSRVYLRFHYASDVIAGFCLGIIWLVLARWILLRTERLG